ncbi:hypothetical protein [Pseudochrobactrum sp. HB0163]|uniref:hypothetical protein n=1 Tax=Pseudochrobactrum sp. HB0163 TaxID=3450708 RepID=UPI003F6E3A60
MKIHEIFSVRRDIDGALLIDADFTGVNTGERLRAVYALRDGDNYGSAPMFRQWLADHPEQEILPYVPPKPQPEPVTVMPAVTLWERLSNDEAEQVEAAMAMQPVRVRQIFMTASTYRSDHELWPVLQQVAVQLFGEKRAAEILAA